MFKSDGWNKVKETDFIYLLFLCNIKWGLRHLYVTVIPCLTIEITEACFQQGFNVTVKASKLSFNTFFFSFPEKEKTINLN